MAQQAVALLVNHTLENINVLESLSLINSQDANLIRSKLPDANALPNFQSGPPSLPPRLSKPEARAKANWDYTGTAPDDLMFRQGDIILIVEEPNDQWWRGKVLGGPEKIGLFPSNHVEKLAPASSPTQEKQMVSYHSPPPPTQYQHNHPVPYQPQHQQQQVQPYYDQQHQVYQPPQKENRWNGLGAQMGTAAAAGVGFGAGSAVASNIVNAIL